MRGSAAARIMGERDSDKQKVVDLSNRLAKRADTEVTVGNLVSRCRELTGDFLAQHLSTMFENVDDALFDMAEKAASNATQAHYFDGMREIRRKRAKVEEEFRLRIRDSFSAFGRGRLRAKKDEPAATREEDLSLVEDDVLEVSLAVNNVASRATSRFQRELFALNQRMGVLAGGKKVTEDNNPAAPYPIADCFREASAAFRTDLSVQLIVFKLFEKYVAVHFGELYRELNTTLSDAGILPNLRPSLRPDGGRARVPARSSEEVFEDALAEDEGNPELQVEILRTLQGLLQARRPQRASTDSSGAPDFQQTDLLNALSVLQSEVRGSDDDVFSVDDVETVKSRVIERAGEFSGGNRNIRDADEDAIDLVSMLFEFILQDRQIPDSIKTVLSRLQIPYLKAALLDKHLFAQKRHPARRLLNEMAQAAMGWSEDADANRKLYNQISNIVQRLLEEFDDSLDLFDELRLEFEQFMEQHRKRAAATERRTAEAAKGREKLLAARKFAAQEILKRVDGKNLPALIDTILRKPWANVLVLTQLRQGRESVEMRTALELADDLAWSGLPKTKPEDAARLRQLLPAIAKRLRGGLELVAYHEEDIKKLFAELRACYAALVAGKQTREQQAALEAFSEEGELGEDDTRLDPSQLEVAARELPEATDIDKDDPFVEQVRELSVGTWFELQTDSGETTRAKLSWISPITSKYLFVNQKGLKVADKTVTVLAAELKRGDAVILDNVPLFDRALNAIVSKLREPAGDAAKESTADRRDDGVPG